MIEALSGIHCGPIHSSLNVFFSRRLDTKAICQDQCIGSCGLEDVRKLIMYMVTSEADT